MKSRYYSETQGKSCAFSRLTLGGSAPPVVPLHPSQYLSPGQTWPSPRELLGFRCLNMTVAISIFLFEFCIYNIHFQHFWNEKPDFSTLLGYNWSMLNHIYVKYTVWSVFKYVYNYMKPWLKSRKHTFLLCPKVSLWPLTISPSLLLHPQATIKSLSGFLSL